MLHINFAVETTVEIKFRCDCALSSQQLEKRKKNYCTIVLEIISGESVKYTRFYWSLFRCVPHSIKHTNEKNDERAAIIRIPVFSWCGPIIY